MGHLNLYCSTESASRGASRGVVVSKDETIKPCFIKNFSMQTVCNHLKSGNPRENKTNYSESGIPHVASINRCTAQILIQVFTKAPFLICKTPKCRPQLVCMSMCGCSWWHIYRLLTMKEPMSKMTLQFVWAYCGMVIGKFRPRVFQE